MIGMTQASLSIIINKGVRPKEETLKRIVSCWKQKEQRLRVLIAHLQDEVSRADVNASEISITSSQMDDDHSLHILAESYNSDPLLKRIVDDLAEMCQKKAGGNTYLQRVADNKGVYKTKRDS
jgi:hypothetical protein